MNKVEKEAEELFGKMRNSTKDESEEIIKNIKNKSKKTNINFWEEKK